MSKKIILVGEKFAKFAEQDHVTTPLAFSAALEDRKIRSCTLIRGQGVSDAWMTHILELADAVDASIEVNDASHWANRASSRSCHKVKRQNALISEPRPIRNETFGCELLIDEDCELMGDHQTGYHLQGMILVEAGRQMFLAVIERFLRPNKENYAVINYLNTKFLSFAFPLDMQIELKIQNRDEQRPDRGAYDVEISFLQQGEVVTVMDTKFTVFEGAKLSEKESAMAQDRTDQVITLSDRQREALTG